MDGLEQTITQPTEPKEVQCPYCLIAEGKIPALTVYTDDILVAALEIKPANTGHVVIFPKKHVQTLSELEDSDIKRLFSLVTKISSVLNQLAIGVNILIAEKEPAGQLFNHLTINIIPRFENDGLEFKWSPKPVDEEQLKKLHSVISEELNKVMKPPTEEIIEVKEDVENMNKRLEEELIKPEDRPL